MYPSLTIISGALTGKTFTLNQREIKIGRDSTNAIFLNDVSVSRKHCLIKRKDSKFFILDLESFNGTFVNGTPITRREIAHGDQISVGDILILFMDKERADQQVSTDPVSVVLEDDNLNLESTVRIELGDAAYFCPEKILSRLPKMARNTRDLSALLEISSALNSIENREELEMRLLALTAGVIPAERGAILLRERYEEMDADAVWIRDTKETKDLRLSKTIVTACLSEVASILVNNVKEDEDLRTAKSLARSEVSSVLCVPLVMFGCVQGLIYLDSTRIETVFDRHHLQLLTGISAVSVGPLENARRAERLAIDNEVLRKQVRLDSEIIGESPRMKKVFSLISRVAPAESTVLILGESGTGKELAARAIHQNSGRKDAPFIAINCATLTDNLLESELFGHERGAFTGAVGQKKGQFEVAKGGTIFLDEIGEMDPALQARLLRVLQEREIQRIGGLKPIKIDVRVIAATNRDLEESIEEGNFREDLYYRLNVINFTMPALRERREDIALLSQFFLTKYNKKCKRNLRGISRQAKSQLKNREWAGNVRELENAIERAVILAQGELIEPEDLPQPRAVGGKASVGDLNFQEAVASAKKTIIRSAIEEAGGNVAEAARKLEMLPNNLHRLIKTLGLRD